MRRSQLPYLALAISVVVCSGSNARSRERPVYCDPPTVTAVAPGQIFDGRYAGDRGAALAPLVLSAVFDFAIEHPVM